MENAQTFILRSPQVIGAVVAAIAQVPTDGSYTVEIRKTREQRRLAQNRLYWLWLGYIARQTGHSRQWLHHRLRRAFLIPLYLEEPQGDSQVAWCEAFSSVSELAQMVDQETARDAIERVKALVSTTWATVQQFTEYLTEVDRFCVRKGIRLPHPDDYHLAMGHERRST